MRFTIFWIYRIWDTLENNRGIFTDSETHPEFTDFETLPILRLYHILLVSPEEDLILEYL